MMVRGIMAKSADFRLVNLCTLWLFNRTIGKRPIKKDNKAPDSPMISTANKASLVRQKRRIFARFKPRDSARQNRWTYRTCSQTVRVWGRNIGLWWATWVWLFEHWGIPWYTQELRREWENGDYSELLICFWDMIFSDKAMSEWLGW